MLELNDEQIELLRFFSPTAMWVRRERPFERAFTSSKGRKTTIMDELAPLIDKIKSPVLPKGKNWSDDMPLLEKGIKLNEEIMPEISPLAHVLITQFAKKKKIYPSRVSAARPKKIGILCHEMSVSDIASKLAHEGGHLCNHGRSRYLTRENTPFAMEGLASNKLGEIGHPSQLHAAQVVGNIANTTEAYYKLIVSLGYGTKYNRISDEFAHDLRYFIASLASAPGVKQINDGHISVEDTFRINDYSAMDFFKKAKITPESTLECNREFIETLERGL